MHSIARALKRGEWLSSSLDFSENFPSGKEVDLQTLFGSAIEFAMKIFGKMKFVSAFCRFQSSKAESSVIKGTVLKGINILKQGSDPIAKEDSEYPAWLWKLLDPKKKDWAPEEKLSWVYQRIQTKATIKKNALMSKT